MTLVQSGMGQRIGAPGRRGVGQAEPCGVGMVVIVAFAFEPFLLPFVHRSIARPGQFGLRLWYPPPPPPCAPPDAALVWLWW